MSDNQRIIQIDLEEQMKSAYIDYSMSVIVSRALPDVRDGLKPVHRRVLYGMTDLGVSYNKPHKKSARIVGEVLGKYHPHGDTSVYDAMVRMAQEWSLRYPLVDGQGNFGSMDGDSPAAMRYTEARLKRITDEILNDLNKDTVDFTLNFDDSLEEPSVMPTKLPNLLINGASGIAVGMATNMMPHHLGEVVDGIIATIEKPEITIPELMHYIKAPDFPTGGIIYGMEGVKEGFETGRGRVVVRGKAEIVTENNRELIIISEIPYQVNKSQLVIKIAELITEKKVEGLSDVRDESDRNGIRIVVEMKRDAISNVILNQLYRFTPLQTSYGINNVALVRGRPMTLNLKDLIVEFIKFRVEVVIRRTKFDLKKAQEKAHILEGLLIALDHLDEVIKLIRNSKTVDDAHAGLMATFNLSDLQSKAILEMRLQRLTGLERDKIKLDYDETMKLIDFLQSILDSEQIQLNIIKDELLEIKEKFSDERRTQISLSDGEINIEDLIPDEEMVITISHLGYIKRTKSTEYRTQGRGGRGSKGSKTRNEDFLEHLFVCTAHDYILFFTELGKCYWMRAYEIPEASKVSTGRAIQNILSIPQEDKIRAYIKIKDLTDKEFLDNNYILFCTKMGTIKKTQVEAFSRPRTNGIQAITINDEDQLLTAVLTDGSSEIVIATKYGRAIRFNESKVRSMGRSAAGVNGVTLSEDFADDVVVGMICVNPNDPTKSVLVVSSNGYGKRSELDDYRITNRGGKGVKTMELTNKTGKLVSINAVEEEDDLMITTKNGIIIRMAVNEIRVMGRATQGVRVIRLDEDEEIADVAIVKVDDTVEDNLEGGEESDTVDTEE